MMRLEKLQMACLTGAVAATNCADSASGTDAEGYELRDGSEATELLRCAGDIDGDDQTAFSDFLILSNDFGSSEGGPADIDGNGSVDLEDFLVLSNDFGCRVETFVVADDGTPYGGLNPSKFAVPPSSHSALVEGVQVAYGVRALALDDVALTLFSCGLEASIVEEIEAEGEMPVPRGSGIVDFDRFNGTYTQNTITFNVVSRGGEEWRRGTLARTTVRVKSREAAPTDQQCGCRISQYECASGQCIDPQYRCDGWDDCSDKSDEGTVGCGCAESQYWCANGGCVSADSTCNGVDDCGDGSDEGFLLCHCAPGYLNENPYLCQCSPSLHQCGGGACVDKTARCDGINDCGDASDESSC